MGCGEAGTHGFGFDACVDPAAIVVSDGRDLVLDVVVKDALGTLWFDHMVAYRQQSAGDNGLTGIFNALANRLLSMWQEQRS